MYSEGHKNTQKPSGSVSVKSENKRLKDKAWKLFSLYIRRKYSDECGMAKCYTCGREKHYKELHAGHGLSGRGGYVLYKEQVVRPQCPGCNLNQPFGKGGNYQVFIPKLIREYSQIQYEEWERESRKPFKRSKADYMQLIRELEAQLSEFDEQGKP